MKYELKQSVMRNEEERASYNELAVKTFGISFEQWFRDGYWSCSNIPYMLFDGKKAVSNVSVNRMKILYRGKLRNYVQLGTVMTEEAYRNKGLAAFLMREVLKDWEKECDSIFLFANRTVSGFYPKFGFEKAKHYEYHIKQEAGAPVRGGGGIASGAYRRLDMSLAKDREQLKTYYEKTNPFSGMQVVENYGLLMFYCGSFMKDCIYYSEKYDVVMIAEQKGRCFQCYDIFGGKESKLREILFDASGTETENICVKFTPEEKEGFVAKEVEDEDNTLFVLRGKENCFAEERLCFPELFYT